MPVLRAYSHVLGRRLHSLLQESEFHGVFREPEKSQNRETGMKRRHFLGGLGGALAFCPVIARALPIARIGYLYTGPKSNVASRVEAIMTGLRESGLAAPVQVELVVPTTDGDPKLIGTLIDEIVAGRVSLFIAQGLAVTRSFRKVAPDVPIVAIDLETDPLASGIAASLARPGGNITGVFLDFP